LSQQYFYCLYFTTYEVPVAVVTSFIRTAIITCHITDHQAASLTGQNAVTWCLSILNDLWVMDSERSRRGHGNVKRWTLQRETYDIAVNSQWPVGSTYWTSMTTFYDVEITCL